MRRALLVMAAIAGCKASSVSVGASPPPPAPASAAVAADAPPEGAVLPPPDAAVPPRATTAKACDATGVPKHLSRIACVEHLDRLEGRAMGFSQSGRYLGFCISVCDACPTTCTFEDSRTHTKVTFTGASALEDPDFNAGRISDEEVQKRVKKRDAKMTRFLEQQGIAKVEPVRRSSAPWPYPDLVLVTRSTTDDARGTTTVELGGSIEGGPPVFVMRVALGPHPLWKEHPPRKPGASPADVAKADAEWRAQFTMDPAIAAAVDITPDGKDIGLVGFSPGMMWFEDAGMARMPLAAFAAACAAGARDAGASPAPPPPRR